VIGGNETDDDYRDRLKTDLDVVSKPGLLRTIVRKIVTLGYRYAQLIEGWQIGCFLSETDGRTFEMNPGGTSNYVVGNTVTATSGGTGVVRAWIPELMLLTVQPTNALAFTVGDLVVDGGISWQIHAEQPTGYPSTRDVYMAAGAGIYLLTDDVTNGLGATWHVELWAPATNMLRLSPVNGVDIADGDTLTGSMSGTARVINHQNVVIGADDARTAIAWDIADIGAPGPNPLEPWVDEYRSFGPAYDLTGWVILDNAEMRGSFCVVLPDIAPPNDSVYPAIYDAVVRMKAAGVLFAAMYKDGSLNPIITFPIPVIIPKPLYPAP
ncbi:MAG: hypothetical protein Q8M65_08250, partial [Rhodoglobus sp.]|nr:hypothetical protein [Rhodoglobus sp.]